MLTVIIASLNRAHILHDTVLSLIRQSMPPDEILLSVVESERDIRPETLAIPGVRAIVSPPGSTLQRNAALDQLKPECDLVTFFDDDVELHHEYLAHCCEFMSAHPEVVGMCGRVIADGILTGEISRSEAIRLLTAVSEMRPGYRRRSNLPGISTWRRQIAEQIRFDERLKLYALYEDYDFSARCGRLGQLVEVDQCQIVHLGTRTSRMSEVRFGYAQIVNPLYFLRKGSQGWGGALRACLRPLISNTTGLIIPRRGISIERRSKRLLGNALGFRDVLFYGPEPERIERI